MKKTVLIAFILILTLSLSACGNSADGNGDTSSVTASAESIPQGGEGTVSGITSVEGTLSLEIGPGEDESGWGPIF